MPSNVTSPRLIRRTLYVSLDKDQTYEGEKKVGEFLQLSVKRMGSNIHQFLRHERVK